MKEWASSSIAKVMSSTLQIKSVFSQSVCSVIFLNCSPAPLYSKNHSSFSFPPGLISPGLWESLGLSDP